MGELQMENCTTVSLRYRFVAQTSDEGDYELFFEAEPSRTLEYPEDDASEDSSEANGEDILEIDVDVNFLRSLDPKDWKEQDHYAVLGLEKLRFKATDDDLKRAYRKMVLKHHPDKRKALGEEILSDDDYFTCITKAYEILGTPVKRRSFDSIDPEFDDSLPSGNQSKKDFFKVFHKYFETNARWSEKKDVPLLGNKNTSRGKVEEFYSFWYNFDSWREFSYLDEEEKEKGQDRDERRWIEKQNKVTRLKRKKEEMARIRTLVDLAYSNDPRIAKFKQEEKDRKLAAKQAKLNAVQAKKEEEEKLQREAQIAKEKEEALEKAKQEVLKQEREVQKKALKKERKIFRDTCKSNKYFSQNQDENLNHMTGVEKICELFKLIELETLNKDLKQNGRTAFLTAMKDTEKRLEEERLAVLESQRKTDNADIINKSIKVVLEWSVDQIQLLIKAVNLFPAGTNQRWEVIANFINQHGNLPEGQSFNAKDVLGKAKDLQNTDFSKSNLKTAANQQAYDNFEKDKRNMTVKTVTDDAISKKIDTTAEINKKNKHNNQSGDADQMENGIIKKPEPNPWTPAEQQLLEQALKTFSNATPDRWDKISECIPNRSKKDCMRRYKELVEIVKAKKAAQAALNK